MDYIRWFHEITATEVELVGGKGANLGEMARANFPVPPGFCLIAPAYRQLMEENQLYRSVQTILEQMDGDDPADVEVKTAQIRDLIRQEPIPEAMAQEIVTGYRQLGMELELADPAFTPVAIRSSATAEDLPTASFAGQQDTYLNIRGEEALLESIRRCWASLWTARAVTYRLKQGFDHQKVYLAVVVQAMIESEVSGILFTANPVSGNRDEVVINASWGLGEAIVSGLVSPDTLTVQKQDGLIKERQTAPKELLISYSDDGGVVELETPDELREAPALTDSQASELTALGLKIEKHYGVPQDIEWGLARDKWYLLQARPITTLETQEKVFDIEGEYSRIMLVEILPDALSPVFLSVLLPLIDGMFDFTFKTLGFKPAQGINPTAAFYNQVYFHRQYIEATLSPLSPKVREALVDQFINPISHERRQPARELSLAYIGMMTRMLRFMVRFPKQLPGILEQYQAEIDEIAAVPLDGASDEKIVSHILSLVFEKINRLLNYDFLVIALTGRTYEILENLLEPIYGEETEEIVSKLNSGLDGNVTMETNKGLWDLAQEAKASAVVSETLRKYEPEVVQGHLQKTAEGQAFLKSLERFFKEYGHREIRFDIIYPTWSEDPTPVFGFLRSYLDSDQSQSPYQQQERLMKERLELTEVVMKSFKRDFKGRLLTGPLFRWMLSQSQVHTRERDTMHFEWTRIFAPARRLLLELGRRWQQRGLLERPEDIFFLHYQELEETAVSPTVWTEVVRTREEEFEASSSRRWPEIIRDGWEVYLDVAEQPSTTEGDMQGVAGSPGVVTGISRVVCGPEEFHKLRKGEILVAPLTNPVWTPLFAVAGGLITEVGGILSHGAIVAREYGIPAVMSVSGATKQIQDGQTITVDGNKGVVYLGAESGA